LGFEEIIEGVAICNRYIKSGSIGPVAAALLVTGMDTWRHLKKMEIILAMNMEKGYTLRGTQQR
jgi:hypothetical protein